MFITDSGVIERTFVSRLKPLFVKPDSLVVALQLAPVSEKEQEFIAAVHKQLATMEEIWEVGGERGEGKTQ